MNRPGKIDFFELSDKILERLNAEGSVTLSHYDIHLEGNKTEIIQKLATKINGA